MSPKYNCFIMNQGYAECASWADLMIHNEGRTFDTINKMLYAFVNDLNLWRFDFIAEAEKEEQNSDDLQEINWADGVRKFYGRPLNELILLLWNADNQSEFIDFTHKCNWVFGFYGFIGTRTSVPYINNGPEYLVDILKDPAECEPDRYCDVFEITIEYVKR